VRPHNLRDVEGISPDTPEDEIWPVSPRVARELVTAYVEARRGVAPVVEATTHTGDFHADPLPFWYLDAVVALLGDPGAPDRVMAYLRDHLADAPSVTTLLDMRTPNVASAGGALQRRARFLALAPARGKLFRRRHTPRLSARCIRSAHRQPAHDTSRDRRDLVGFQEPRVPTRPAAERPERRAGPR